MEKDYSSEKDGEEIKDKSDSSRTAIINIDFEDYFKMAQKNPIVFIYLGFYVAFNTVQVISQRVVGRAEETST